MARVARVIVAGLLVALLGVWPGSLAVAAGSQINQIVCQSTTSQANTLTAADEIVGQCSVPAEILNANGMTIRIMMGGITASNTNSKVFKIWWGGTGAINAAITGGTLCSPGNASTTTGANWLATCYVTRTASNAQLVWGGTRQVTGSASTTSAGPVNATATLTDTAANLVNVTANAATAVGDLTFKVLVVELVN